MSLRERPFLYDIMGGSLKIRFSNDYCCIRYHFLAFFSFEIWNCRVVLSYEGQHAFFCLVSLIGGGLVSFVQTSSESALLVKFCG